MPPTNFYAAWRVRCGLLPMLRESPAAAPPERLLQAVWMHQRLQRDRLTTLDGQTVRVLHPGFKNVEAGPDFRGAVIQIGDAAPRSGDVEVDLNVNGWWAHGHDGNPNFKNVILHVVWERPLGVPALAGPVRASQELPTMTLKKILDAPLRELDLWLGGEAVDVLPENLLGRCAAPLRELPPERVTELLHQAAQVRLQGKAAWFQARAKQSGWEQALWEGLFRALGYKQNVWPMLRLAELRTQFSTGKQLTPLAVQARLLGVGGLLPTELTRAQAGADGYLRRVWDLWWRERDEFGDVILPRTVWKFNGLRPANHPQRRLALAAHWLAAGDLVSKFERWCAADIPVGRVTPCAPSVATLAASGARGATRPTNSAALVDSLLKLLQVERDEFWSWHWTLRSARMLKPQPLLGAARVTDLAVNVILPWLWARASEGKNAPLQQTIEQRYFAWPAAEDNALLKLARQRLLGGATRRALPGAAAQQGLLQIVRDFCDHSNAVCDECKFPDLVSAWKV